MGHFYAQMIFGIDAPRVGLLSIGEEEGKGNELTKETFRVLKETGLNFIGNAEGRDVFNGNAHVIVCDGFIGNVVLKASEALGEMVNKMLRSEVTRTPVRKVGAAILRGAFNDIKKRMDYPVRRRAAPRRERRLHHLARPLEREGDQERHPRVANGFAQGRVDKIRVKIAICTRASTMAERWRRVMR
jgi:hypothetical protein